MGGIPPYNRRHTAVQMGGALWGVLFLQCLDPAVQGKKTHTHTHNVRNIKALGGLSRDWVGSRPFVNNMCFGALTTQTPLIKGVGGSPPLIKGVDCPKPLVLWCFLSSAH